MKFKIGWSGKAIEYTDEEVNTVVNVMKHADPQTQGKHLAQFESDFSEFIGQKNCFGLTNCTHALELAADLAGIKSGDEVIIPAHTYCASAIPFGRTGAKLRWADMDPDTFLVSLDSIKELTTPQTRVIVVVHLYGMMCDVPAIAEYAKTRGIILIEDVAQAIGAKMNGQSAGTFGDFGAFSFHGQKNVTMFGEGGALTLKDSNLAKLVPGLRHNGHKPFSNQSDYWVPAMTNVDVDLPGIWPHNFSLTECQAALGSKLLTRVDALNSKRRARAQRFKKEFAEFPEVIFQKEVQPESHVHHLLPIQYDGRKTKKTSHDLIKSLSEQFGIKAIVQYYPLYRYDLFKKMGYGNADCPYTDRFFDNMVSIPFHSWMSDDDFDYLIRSTRSALENLRGK